MCLCSIPINRSVANEPACKYWKNDNIRQVWHGSLKNWGVQLLFSNNSLNEVSSNRTSTYCFFPPVVFLHVCDVYISCSMSSRGRNSKYFATSHIIQNTCLHFSPPALTVCRQKQKITSSTWKNNHLVQGFLATWDETSVFYSSINQHGLNTLLTRKSSRFWLTPKGFLPISYCSFLLLTSSCPLDHLGSFDVTQSVNTASPAARQLQ